MLGKADNLDNAYHSRIGRMGAAAGADIPVLMSTSRMVPRSFSFFFRRGY